MENISSTGGVCLLIGIAHQEESVPHTQRQEHQAEDSFIRTALSGRLYQDGFIRTALSVNHSLWDRSQKSEKRE